MLSGFLTRLDYRFPVKMQYMDSINRIARQLS